MAQTEPASAPSIPVEIKSSLTKPDGSPLELSPFLVGDNKEDDNYDPTGMDGPEMERAEPPFSNELVMAETSDDEALASVSTELQALSGVPPADLAAGLSRINLKGFPTPRQRNGYIQVGVPEVLNTQGMEMIQGPLIPVVGRAAPGGIENFTTSRPRGKTISHFSLWASSRGQRNTQFDTTGTVVPKRVWDRIAAGAAYRQGPEPFSYDHHRYVDGALIWKASRAASIMAQIDYDERNSNFSPGIPEYRTTETDKISAPYLPLAYFNTFGPNAGFRKRTLNASVQFEAQPFKNLSIRGGTQYFNRQYDEDRWTMGQYVLNTAKFDGKREPLHTEQPLDGVTSQIDATIRFYALKADHKVTASIENSHTDFQRVQRALQKTDRDALPPDILTFDPAAPNYTRPSYSTDLYSRFITNRRDITDFTGVFLSERSAFLRGKLVLTAGVRDDFVTIDVTDRRPANPTPHVRDHVSQLSNHFGANYIMLKNRLLVFASTSSAFEPSTRVDARTGKVQGNETTLGYEAGVKALAFDRKVSLIAMAFTYFNQNISRRNPLYDDPILDANQTQAQLLAGGEERFTGFIVEGKTKLTPEWTITGRGTYNNAITTKSPDLPEEVGRPLTRFPHLNWVAATRYAFAEGSRWAGLSLNVAFLYISGFVSSYENVNHHYLAYPGYYMATAGVNYHWKSASAHYEHNVNLGVRNLTDRDLLAQVGRTSGGREYSAGYTLTF